MKKKIEYTVNVDIHGMKAGQTILLDVDKNGTPLDRNWRRRLNDAKLDGCITKTDQPTPAPAPTTSDKKGK